MGIICFREYDNSADWVSEIFCGLLASRVIWPARRMIILHDSEPTAMLTSVTAAWMD